MTEPIKTSSRGTPERLAYIAGFVDGEGCIRIAANNAVSLRIINTSLPVLTMIQEVLGVGTVKPRKAKVNKAQYCYAAYGQNCISALEQILPYLVEKKQQAELVIEYKQQARSTRIPGQRGLFKNQSVDVYKERVSDLKYA